YELCKTHGIPTPEVLAVFTPTGQFAHFQSGLPPQYDLFVKARAGAGGQGTERFQWSRSFFQSNRGCRLRPEDLCDYLPNRERAENLTLLVQPGLSNHPDIHAEPHEALATARLVTGRSFDGEVAPIFCFMLWGLTNKITAHSNYVTLVDVANGQFIPVPPQDCTYQSIYQYRRCNTCSLPDWNAAVRHVTAAHKACSNFVFIGWDVAFPPDGATVLEGNTNWSPATYQTLQGEPLGFTKFADILATHLSPNRHLEKYPRP